MSLGTAQLRDTRALKKPPKFSGNDEDWSEGSLQFLGYVCLESRSDSIDALEDTFATQSRNLYFLLTQLVSGRAFVILRAVPNQHGYEAWRPTLTLLSTNSDCSTGADASSRVRR
eukprot:3526124-Amphidinium_carterae.4